MKIRALYPLDPQTMCRATCQGNGEVLAVCTRAKGHRGHHWMEAPRFPRVTWKRGVKRVAVV